MSSAMHARVHMLRTLHQRLCTQQADGEVKHGGPEHLGAHRRH